VGTHAPAFQVRDLDDQVVDLAGLRGHPVWLNFWATWCPPCKAEMPLMEQQYQQHQAAGLVILGVNIQESPAVIRAWTQQRFHWRFVPDPQGTLATLYRIEGLPSHVFIDRTGVVRSIHIGELGAADMATNLAEILPP
jgi:thiol-disulfide isomerase/thioredoxin